MNRKVRFSVLGAISLLLLSGCSIERRVPTTAPVPTSGTSVPSTPTTVTTSEPTSAPTSVTSSTPTSAPTSSPTTVTSSSSQPTTASSSKTTTATPTTGTSVSPEPSGYYSKVTDSMSGSTLQSTLKSIISTGVSTSYDWSRYEACDQDPNNSSNVLMIYARTSMSKSAHVSGTSGWNREHTFPQSKIEVTQAKSDNHIVFASDNKVNGSRSNYRLGDLTSYSPNVNDCTGKTTPCKRYAKNSETFFDPGDTQGRGEVARATLYAATMYSFDIEDNFESLALCLQWHLTYAVAARDIFRNETIYKNQKNRNPFVDHPEYACRIWGSTNSATKAVCGM